MRLFVGAPVPGASFHREATRRALALGRGVRPVRDGTWHATLRFLGEVAAWEPVRAALDGAMAGAEGGPARVDGLGAFPSPGRARVLWAGLDAPCLPALHEAVVRATAGLGERPDPRQFRTHVTLARCDPPVDARAWAAAPPLPEPGAIDRVVLYASQPGPGGSVYTELAAWFLAPS